MAFPVTNVILSCLNSFGLLLIDSIDKDFTKCNVMKRRMQTWKEIVLWLLVDERVGITL